MTKELEKIGKFAMNILKFVTVLLFMAMVVIVFAQVFTRFILNASFTWSEEVSRFLMVWMVYMAGVITFSANEHIAVDALTSRLKGMAKDLIKILNKLAVLAFSVFIVIGAIRFLPTVSMQKSPANNIIMSFIYVAIPISMGAIGIICITDILVILKRLFSKHYQHKTEVSP